MIAKYPNKFILIAVAACLLLSAFTGFKQDVLFIELKSEHLSITPKEFYISRLIDDRADNTGIGKLIPAVAAQGKLAANISVDLKGGFPAIKTFIDNGLPANKNLRPVVIKLKALKVTETSLSGGRVNGLVSLSVSFGLQGEDEVTHLTDYLGSATYQRSAGPAQQIEPLLRSTLINSLVYFNNWMNRQADKNILLAKGVKIIFDNYVEPVEGDTIYYSTNRPLKWTDFRQKPRLTSNHGAEIFASLGYDEKAEIINGIVNVKLDLKVYAPKSACWVRGDVSDAHSLNHEQRHFDIVKLVAEHFKQNILAEKLSPANYDGPINVAYLEALREIDRLQKQYDGETHHSIDIYRQQLWNSKIDKELQQIGIKPTAI